MTPGIQEQLQATGHAQVIVVLKSQARRAGSGVALESTLIRGSSLPTDLEKQRFRQAARALERLFAGIAESREGALALADANARDSSRRGVSSALESTDVGTAKSRAMIVFDNLGILLGTTDRAGVRALSADSRVQTVTSAPELSLIRPESRRVARAGRHVSWGLRRLRIPTLWEQGLSGRGVLLGHLDTGVDAGHAALKGAIAEFTEFDWLGRPVPAALAHDLNGHGTHKAGTIVGRKVGRMQFGAAPEAQLASALVVEGGNVIARILGGLNWLVGLRVRAINL